jgi:hypothetical protein
MTERVHSDAGIPPGQKCFFADAAYWTRLSQQWFSETGKNLVVENQIYTVEHIVSYAFNGT